jgi:hypothetical protein
LSKLLIFFVSNNKIAHFSYAPCFLGQVAWKCDGLLEK